MSSSSQLSETISNTSIIKIPDFELDFYPALEESIAISNRRFDLKHNKDEARGTDKLKPIHGYIARSLQSILNPQFYICAYGVPFEVNKTKISNMGQELPSQGFYGVEKRGDITIATRKTNLVLTPKTQKIAKNQYYEYHSEGTIFYRGIFNNLSQNEGNLLNNFLSETLLLRRAGYPIGQIFVVAHHAPWRRKNGSIKHTETFNGKNLDPYIELYKQDPLHTMERPNAMCVIVVDIDINGKISKVLDEALDFSVSQQKVYKELSDFNKFIRDCASLWN